MSNAPVICFGMPNRVGALKIPVVRYGKEVLQRELVAFANTEPKPYVRNLRNASHLLQTKSDDAASAQQNRCPLWTSNRKYFPMDDIALFDLPG